MIVNDELETKWNNEVVAYFKGLSKQLAGKAKKGTNNLSEKSGFELSNRKPVPR
jgi:hypothetical protein